MGDVGFTSTESHSSGGLAPIYRFRVTLTVTANPILLFTGLVTALGGYSRRPRAFLPISTINGAYPATCRCRVIMRVTAEPTLRSSGPATAPGGYSRRAPVFP